MSGAVACALWDLPPAAFAPADGAGWRHAGHHLFLARTGPAAVTFDGAVGPSEEAVLDALLTLSANGAATVTVDDVFREMHGRAEPCRSPGLRRGIERAAARLARTRAYVGGRCAGYAVPAGMLAA